MRNKKAVEDKYNELEKGLKGQETFFIEDAERVLGDIKRNTVYWYLSAMIDAGYIKRIRRGMYAFDSWKAPGGVSISQTASEIKKIMDESGFYYYLSGLDILSKYMLHVPEQYPILLFAEKAAKDEIADTLKSKDLEVLLPTQIKDMGEKAYRGMERTPVIMYPTENFDFCKDSLADIEKAFVDLYYAVTRNGYPLSIQELVRIYENLIRAGGIDTKRMIRAASMRSIQYDIRFIVESKYITEGAKRFEQIMNGGNKR